MEKFERIEGGSVLAATQQLLRNFFGALREAVFVIDAKTFQIIDCNSAAQEMFGYSREEMVGQDISFLHVDETEQQVFKDYLHRALKERGYLHLPELPMKRRNGDIFVAEHSITSLEDDHGRFVWISVIGDITERRRYEEALKESERRFRLIFDSAMDGIVIVDATTRKALMGNKTMCAMLGCTQDELQTMRADDFHPADALPRVMKHLEETARGDISVAYEMLVKRKDGSIFYADISASTLLLGGKMHFIGIFRDTTGRKRAAQELQLSEEKFRRMIETAQEGVLMVDAEAHITYANSRIAEMFGCSETELLSGYLFDYVHEEFRDKARESFERRKKGLKEIFDVRFKRKDGSLCWGLVSATPVTDAHGRFAGSFSMITDITERKRAEEALAESEERFRNLFVNLRAVALVIDSMDGSIVEANSAAVAYYGWTREQLMTMKISDINTQPHAAILNEMELARAGQRSYFVYQHRKADGDIRDVEIYSGPVWLQGRTLLYSIVHDITDRKKAEEKLQQSEERLRSVIETVPAILWAVDSSGTIVLSEGRAVAALGLKPGELVGQSVFEVYKNDTKALSLIRRGLDGEEFAGEIEVGGRHWSNRYVPNRDESGRVIGLIGISVDMTEHKEAELALRESEERLRQAIRVSQSGIFYHDHLTDTIYWSSRQREIYGWGPDEPVTLKAFLDCVYPGDRERIAVTVRRAHDPAGAGLFDVEHRIIRRDGATRWVSTRSQTFFDGEDGERRKVRTVGATVDITERKKAEETLQESAQFIRNMLDTVDEGFIVIDRQFRILTANRAYCTQVSLPSDEVVRRHCYELSHNKDRPCSEEGEECPVEQVSATGTPHMAVHRHQDRDGNVLYVETKAFPITDSAGRVTSVIETINNITEKHLLEEERLKVQKLESIGTLAGGIAHDFNNLLQGVFGYISLARLSLDRPEEVKIMLERAEEALNLSVNLTTQLLTFSKGGKPVKELIRLQSAIENPVRFALSGSHTDYLLDIAVDLWPVEADEGQLAQVIQNIVLNANQAMVGGGTVRVSAINVNLARGANPGLPDGGAFVRIDIQDTGTGIPEEHLSKIFDPYFTTKQKGIGLGLATSYSIIRNHGGVIEVKSELNKGSTFTIYLPAARGVEIKAEAATPSVHTKKGRVLLMDDEEMVRNVVREMIAALGHEVECVADGKEAIEVFMRAREAGRPFNLVILDLTVKRGMGGEEAIRRLREIDPEVVAVVSSGYASNPVMADYSSYGFSAFLNKPYKIDPLRDCLNKLLKQP